MHSASESILKSDCESNKYETNWSHMPVTAKEFIILSFFSFKTIHPSVTYSYN